MAILILSLFTIVSIVIIPILYKEYLYHKGLAEHKKEIDLEIMLFEGKKRLRENEKKWKETEKGN